MQVDFTTISRHRRKIKAFMATLATSLSDTYGEGRHHWKAQLLATAQDYGFIARACRPYRARTKGKVERFNGYLKGSFITLLAATLHQAGLRLDVATANAHIRPWLELKHISAFTAPLVLNLRYAWIRNALNSPRYRRYWDLIRTAEDKKRWILPQLRPKSEKAPDFFFKIRGLIWRRERDTFPITSKPQKARDIRHSSG
jgi:hypothetical protein